MIELDGSTAGGQFLRSALSLSALSATPIRVSNIRASRSPPGLRPQHLATVRLLTDICDATTTGATIDSQAIAFAPDAITEGEYTVDIGTAGSITLLFDALLPLAGALSGPLTVTATGGTDVRWSPPLDYFQHVKLPLLSQFGAHAATTRTRTGFYPKGGGAGTLSLYPTSPSPLDLTTRGTLNGARVFSTAANALAHREVADRQRTHATDVLTEHDIPIIETITRYTDTDSPGSSICIRLDYHQTYAGFDALGERGTPAETVGTTAATDAVAFTTHGAATDRYMADQLLVHLVQAGGQIAIPTITDHVKTSLSLLRDFDYHLDLDDSPPDHVLITA